jgi:hypothetical protein
MLRKRKRKCRRKIVGMKTNQIVKRTVILTNISGIRKKKKQRE